MKIIVIAGTRPEFIKFFSVCRAIEAVGSQVVLVHTGQHYSASLDSIFFKELGLPHPAYRVAQLPESERTFGKVFSHTVFETSRIIEKEKPDVVLVEGDTNSVLAGALAACAQGVLVGHVEAGLRSNNDRMAEERNRVAVSHMSRWLFAPTHESVENLTQEGFTSSKVHQVGNTIVDAVNHFLPVAKECSVILTKLGLQSGEYILATVHRAECTEKKEYLKQVLDGIAMLAREARMRVVLPLHPRTRKSIDEFSIIIPREIEVVLPLGYLDLLALLAQARLAVTDSGGIQEEACILGVPVVTVREDTERPETVVIGANVLAGYDPQKILTSGMHMLSTKAKWQHPYGEYVGERIIDILRKEY